MRYTGYSDSTAQRTKWTLLYIMIFAFLAQSVIITLFSAQNAEVSAELSRRVEKPIKAVLEAVSRSAGKKPIDSSFSLHAFIRKAAHFYNFFVLGSIIFSILTCVGFDVRNLVSWTLPGFFVSVIDEAHQHFVPGRSAQIVDVFIDFSGVLFGICLFTVVYASIFKKRC